MAREELLHKVYRETAKVLKYKIKEAEAKCWEELRDTLDKDL